jgi:hypothetical protein
MLRSDLSEIIKKSKTLNELDSKRIHPVNMLIENILLVETICMYEGIILGSTKNMQEAKKQEFYDLHLEQLQNDIMNRLYLNYQSTQSNISNIGDEAVLQIADQAKQEMQKTLRLIEEVIKILQP